MCILYTNMPYIVHVSSTYLDKNSLGSGSLVAVAASNKSSGGSSSGNSFGDSIDSYNSNR